MAALDFDFIKERGIGDLISDFLSLFKKIFKHFNKTILLFLLPFLALFLLLFFFASSLGVDIFYSKDFLNPGSIGLIVVVSLLLLFLYFIFIPTFGIEYMFLLEENGNTDFTAKEVWDRVRANFGKYVAFFFSSLLVGLIIMIPVGFAVFILAFIPLIGSLAIGLLSACISVVGVCALFLYLKNREGLFDSFLAGFNLVKKKFFQYGISAYLFRILVSVCLGLLSMIPLVILGILAYNYVGWNENIFISFTGKLLVSIGGSILLVATSIGTLYTMSFYTLIYFSSLEDTNKEGTLDQIDQIGSINEEG